MTESPLAPDDGSAAIELVAAVVLLVLPVIYLVVAIAQIQAATFATEGAARDVVRAYVIADDDAMAAGRADAVAALAFGDHAIDPDAARLHVTCSATPCLTAGASVDVRVATRVVLPGTDLIGLPGLAVSVSAQHRGVIETLREVP